MSATDYSLDSSLFEPTGKPESIKVVTPGLIDKHLIQVLACARRDNRVIFQGDIVLSKVSDLTIFDRFRATAESFGLGFGFSSRDHKWPMGVIPYTYRQELEEIVVAAIDHWQAKTPIRFVPYTGEQSAFVLFSDEGGFNSSPIGYKPGLNTVTLVPGVSLGTAIHEIGHLVGLWHENCRVDHEQHIKIHWENISEEFHDQFRPLDGMEAFGDYDLGSQMHYSEDAFAKETGLITISALDGSKFGNTIGLSDGDIAAVEQMYDLANSIS